MDNIAVSNIAWTENNEDIFTLLQSLGVNGVEVAPGKINGGWENIDTFAMQRYRDLCASYDLKIPSFQAFLFGKPHLQLLGNAKVFSDFKDHVKFVSELAAAAGAEVLVYGAPKSRLLLNHSYDDGFSLAKERLAELADICWANQVSIGLEAVPAAYGGEIIKSYRDSAKVCEEVNHPGLVFHLDTGCTYLNNDSIEDAINELGSRIRHFHISQPNLSDFSRPMDYHFLAAKSLGNLAYKKFLCVEMLETDNPLISIKKAVEFVKKNYCTYAV